MPDLGLNRRLWSALEYEVIVQEDLPQGFKDPLATLDHELARSLLVIHLVGDLAGSVPKSASLRELRTRHPDLLNHVPDLREAVGDYLHPVGALPRIFTTRLAT
jgi:hypothetical protein